MHHPRLAQPSQMTRRCRLHEPELGVHDVDQLTGRHLAAGEVLDDAATSRISQDSESLHTRNHITCFVIHEEAPRAMQ